MGSVRAWRVLNRSQSMVLTMLRFLRQDAPWPSVSWPGESALLERLARHPRVRAMAICAGDVPIVTQDEELLLAGLAAAQRKSGLSLDDRGLLAELERCAAALSCRGIQLPLTVPLRALLESTGWISPRVVRTAGKAGDQALRRELREGTIRSRAIHFVRTNGIVSMRQFNEIGVSRQQISTLCVQGYLRRVRYGAYALP